MSAFLYGQISVRDLQIIGLNQVNCRIEYHEQHQLAFEHNYFVWVKNSTHTEQKRRCLV